MFFTDTEKKNSKRVQTKIIRKKVKEQMKSNIKWLKKNLWTGEKIRVEEVDKKNKK